MRREFIIVAILMVWGAGLWASEVSVMSWNVRNYLVCDRMVDGVWRRGYPKPEVEKAAVDSVIKAANPDVLAIMEIGGADYFAEFQARLKNAGLDYPYAALMRGADTSRYLGVLSRVPFESVSHPDLPIRYNGQLRKVLRGCLELRFNADAGSEELPWRLYLVHLKSQAGENATDPESDIFRAAEATAIRDMIGRSLDGVEAPAYLVMGDFNDGPRSRALARFLKKGKTKLTVPLTALDSHGEDWTERWAGGGIYSRIDYALASPALVGWVSESKIIDSPDVQVGSDHRPIWVELNIPRAGRKNL
jgi:endonuclease/exonuclease/phosphatase family metal-dependent hydrolase